MRGLTRYNFCSGNGTFCTGNWESLFVHQITMRAVDMRALARARARAFHVRARVRACLPCLPCLSRARDSELTDVRPRPISAHRQRSRSRSSLAGLPVYLAEAYGRKLRLCEPPLLCTPAAKPVAQRAYQLLRFLIGPPVDLCWFRSASASCYGP